MGNAKNCLVWDHFEQLNGVSKCKHCKAEFRGNPSAARLRCHLVGLLNKNIRICKEVPADVKKALDDGSSINNVTNSISISAPQQNDASVNLVPHHFDRDVAYDSNNIPQLSAQNPAQIGESIQSLVVQGAKNDNLAADHNSVDMIGCNTIEEPGALNQTKANSSSNDGSNKRPRIELGSSSNDVTNSISTFAYQQNDASVDPVPEEDSTYGEREDTMELDRCREEQDTRVPTHVDNALAKCSNNRSQLEISTDNNEYSSETGGVKGDEVGCLSNLETLHLSFNDPRDFNNYIQSLLPMHTESQQLNKHILLLGCPTQSNEELRNPMLYDCEYDQHLYFTGCSMIKEVLLPEHIQKLGISKVSIEDVSGLCLKNAIDLKQFIIEESEEIEYLFCMNSSPSIFLSLETVYVSYLKKLRGLFGRAGDNGVIPMQFPPNGTFSCLKKFKLYECHNVKKLFPFGLLSNLQNLEELEVYFCLKMKEIIASEEQEQEEKGKSNTLFSLPNLRRFELWNLNKLKSISSAKLQCDSLQSVTLYKCPKLKKIPISLPLASLKKIIACEESWNSVEWGHFNDKLHLQDNFLHRIS